MKLGELCEIVRGSSPRPQGDPRFYGGFVPRLMVADVTRDGKYVTPKIDFLTEEGAKKSRHMKKGDLVIAVSGNPGLPSILEIDACIHDGFVGLRNLDQTKVLVDYLYRYLLFFKQKINNQAVGAIFKNLTTHQIAAIHLPLPPLEEQRRIAAILDKADGVRRKRKEAIALTEELLRSAFLDMFGDPVTNPKGWEEVTVDDLVSIVRDGPHVSPRYSDEGIPILSTRNIRPSKLIMEDVKYISEEIYWKLVDKFRPQHGDVLLTKGGTTGYAKVVDWEWPFAIWVHIAALRPLKNKVRPEFLECALNSPNCYEQSQRYTHGIANRDLGLSRIRKIKMTLPPMELQKQFCDFRKILLRKQQNQEKSGVETDNLFNSLLQRAFRGEL